MRDYNSLLRSAADRSLRYLEHLGSRPVAPAPEAVGRLERLGGALPDGPADPELVLNLLDEFGSPATVATAGGRYFGFVVGGSLPATVAANWLAAAWDQLAGMVVQSPVAAYLEETVQGWLVDLLGLPPETGAGFVCGDTMANFAALAAARHALLARAGWDVESKGLFEAPPITVIVSEETHISVLKCLAMLGLGRDRVVRVPVDGEGRMRAEDFPRIPGPSIVCLQAGNVNTGSFDPAEEVVAAAHASGAWVHVDGAFGLWAAAAPERSHLARGFAGADSWALDAHKWLNVPYDSGVVLVRDARQLHAAMTSDAAYLMHGQAREPWQYTPGMSRRARGIEIWTALRSLGRSGLADLIERCCRHAARFAGGLREAGFEILNDVVLNQVLVSFGDEATTRRVAAAIQRDGVCWCACTVWQGRTAVRISVCSWATTSEDVELSLTAILRAAREVVA